MLLLRPQFAFAPCSCSQANAPFLFIRPIVDIYRDQNISKSTIYCTIKECQEEILWYGILVSHSENWLGDLMLERLRCLGSY
jgi:hypothetical protein